MQRSKILQWLLVFLNWALTQFPYQQCRFGTGHQAAHQAGAGGACFFDAADIGRRDAADGIDWQRCGIADRP